MKLIRSINGYVLPFSTSQYKDRLEPLWSKDTGRETLEGDFTGTKVGDFPKIICTFPVMPSSVTSRFRRECKKEVITLEWYNTTKEKYVTSEFHLGGALEADVLMVLGSTIILNPFTVEFIAMERE